MNIRITYGQADNDTSNIVEHNIKPALVTDINDNYMPGIDFDLSYRWVNNQDEDRDLPQGTFIIRAWPSLEFDATGTFTGKPDLNPKQQQLNLRFNYLFRLQRTITFGEDFRPETYFGTIFTGLNLKYEADQPFAEQHAAGGIELRYTNSANWYIPDLDASFNFVRPLRSELRRDIDEDLDVYQRIDFQFWWQLPIGNKINVMPKFRYFYSLNLSDELADRNIGDGFYTSVNIGYRLDSSERLLLNVFDFVYIQYNRGELPVYEDNRETLEAGVIFRF